VHSEIVHEQQPGRWLLPLEIPAKPELSAAARHAAAYSLNGLSAQSQDAVSAFIGRVN
jgi:hypothetical protein